ncbi:hypothetical protein L2E82_21360 [Cichorium intybus]|uniref:Uncharacterized protein n=1 Tax=Cichorium intybus TaxID=13427 RepID=A0ACB9DVZ2_CICIN|nr:hypothetical protein L2E82_21360 [Cichorium intybus]
MAKNCLLQCINRDCPGGLPRRRAQCAQDQGGVRPGAVRLIPGAVRLQAGARQGTSDSLTFVWLVRFSSNLDHRLVMAWDKMVVVHEKARNNRDLNAASIQVDMASRDENDQCKNICKRQDQISRCHEVACKATKLGCEILRDICSYRLLMSLQVSMLLIGDKIKSVTLEVGLVDAVSSSPASKEILGCFVLKAGCYKLVSEPWFK